MTNMDSAETTPDSKFKNLIEANNVSGILKLLEPSEKKNIDNACNVFAALTETIIKILAKCPQYVNVAEQGCRQIMNSHMETIHSMMSSHSKPKHKKAVLKLLTAIVSLGKTFPRELLNHLTLHPLLVDALASHNKPTDPENVRTCFIHFLLSFIIEGNSSTIKALLDKRGVLSSIFADLIYDSCEIVQLVLKTLKKYILENSSITKTIKIHLFNTSAIESLVNLYNWKGPKNWQGFKKTDKILEPVDVEEKNMTLNALHELLITLMTSTRYGIVFHDHSLGTDSGRKHNHFIDVILQSLERPWEHEKPSELVVEILASCPDLISSQFISMEPYLEPRVSAKWATALQFIGKIIDNIDIEKCLKSCLEKMSYLKFTEALLNLIMPPTVIKNAVVPSLENENTCIHYKTIQIMYTMMKKVESFLKFMENSEVNVEDFKNVKMITDEHVKNNVPAFDNLANAWMKAFSQNLETDNSELNESEEDITKLKVKAFSILVHLNPSGFSASMDIFGMVLTFLLTNIGCSDVSLDSDIRITLNLLINSSGIFDGFDGLDIWIDSISKFENKIEKTELAEWLAKLVKRVCKNTDKYKQLPCLEDRMDVDDDSVDQENPNDLQNNMLPFISISPLLNAAIQSLEKHSTTSESLYMSHVLMHTLHCQVSPTTLILLLKNVDIPALSYIKSWLEGETPLVISEPFAKNTVFSMMSEILLSADQPALVDDNNFGSNNNELSVELKKKRHTYALTRFEMKYLLKLVIFYAVQNMKQSNGHLKKLELFKKIVSSILKMGKALQEDSDGFLKECASWFFKNPVILKYFHGLSKKKTASTSDGTIFFKSICQMFFDMNKQEMIAPLMVPYQNKFVENFKSFISKQREDKLKKDLHYSENIIDILQINVERAKEFVDEIMSITCEKFLTSDKFNLSVWGIMLPEFMNRILKFKLTTQSIAIESGTIGKILLCMTELLKFDAELTSWVTAIRDLFLKYPQQLTTIDENIFMALLTSKKIASIKEIFALVIFENSMCMDLFMKFIKNNEDFYQQQDVLFYILSKNVDQKWKKKFISTLFNLYKNDIVTYVTTLKTNNKCLENNIGAIGYFIDNCFDPEECKKMCDGILLNAEVLDHAQEIHIQVLKKLFIKSLPVYPDALKSLVQVFLRITLIVLKKEPKNTSKLNNICQSLIEAIADLKTKASVSHFEDLSKNHSWPLFTRICLKVGLKNSKKTETEKLLVLKALLVTCDLAYEDDCKEEYVKTIFEMTTSHSEFVNTMLSNNSNLKDDLIELLYILTKKNNTTMAETQVSLYLASYGATLSRSDQLILQILFNFEKNGLEFSKYQPFLWGEAAATHYSVKGGADTILFRQTSTSEVFDLLQSDIVSNTIKNFPVHRNSLTEVMEIDSGDKIYDPQFYLSLFQQLLEPNNVVPCHKVIHSGAFALAIAACSSTCSLIRGKALSVISKYCFHIEATSSKEKELWLNFIQVLRNGIIESGVPIKELRLNGFVSTFLAKASLVMRSPTDKLYKPIQSFLMAKPVLDINSIPEFITLFNSSDIDYKAHRHWILGIVRDGLKTDEDMNIAFRKMVFHTLFMFYNSILCDKMSKVLILQIMKSATKLPKGCLILVKSYCLTSWLITAGKKLGNTDNEARRCLTDIIKNIYHACSVKNYEPKFSLLTLKELEKLL